MAQRVGDCRERGGAPTLVGTLVELFRLARPAIWMVSILPLWAGYVLATHRLVPTSPRAASTMVVALVVMGPLVWAAGLAINDVHDLPGDRRNPRKAASPLVRLTVRPQWAHRMAYGCAALALAAAAWVGHSFAVLTGAFLALAWAYSVPPVRLKNRPGADLGTNTIGIGLIPVLAGWSIARPLGAFPWWFVPQCLVVAVALYVPTTLVDYEADRAAGERTLATRLGPALAYRIGVGAWVAANVGVLVLAAARVVIPRSILPFLGVLAPVLLAEYHWLVGHAKTSEAMVRGIVVVSATFLIPSALFALAYTGLWPPF